MGACESSLYDPVIDRLRRENKYHLRRIKDLQSMNVASEREKRHISLIIQRRREAVTLNTIAIQDRRQ